MQRYYVEQETRVSPVAGDEMQRLIAAGRIGPESLVWRSGLKAWEPAAQHFGFPGASAGWIAIARPSLTARLARGRA